MLHNSLEQATREY